MKTKTIQGVAPNRGASGPREGLEETRYRHGAKSEERVYPPTLHEMNRARRDAFFLMAQQRDRRKAPLLVTFPLDTVMGRVMALKLRDLGWLKIEPGEAGRQPLVVLSEVGEWILGGAPAKESPSVTRGHFVKVMGIVMAIGGGS